MKEFIIRLLSNCSEQIMLVSRSITVNAPANKDIKHLTSCWRREMIKYLLHFINFDIFVFITYKKKTIINFQGFYVSFLNIIITITFITTTRICIVVIITIRFVIKYQEYLFKYHQWTKSFIRSWPIVERTTDVLLKSKHVCTCFSTWKAIKDNKMFFDMRWLRPFFTLSLFCQHGMSVVKRDVAVFCFVACS